MYFNQFKREMSFIYFKFQNLTVIIKSKFL